MCDDKFLDELHLLDNGRPVPEVVKSAYSWFNKKNTGSLFVFAPAKNLLWSLSASCEGGDGRPTQYCVYQNAVSKKNRKKIGGHHTD
jgi:hypothetical protein